MSIPTAEMKGKQADLVHDCHRDEFALLITNIDYRGMYFRIIKQP
jgi:hypothetical protein